VPGERTHIARAIPSDHPLRFGTSAERYVGPRPLDTATTHGDRRAPGRTARCAGTVRGISGSGPNILIGSAGRLNDCPFVSATITRGDVADPECSVITVVDADEDRVVGDGDDDEGGLVVDLGVDVEIDGDILPVGAVGGDR